ncbi:lipid II flippase MurJ [Aeromonas allosaccharophila]|uniref:lipid II flippase MurJ n=1 Tax=Aeromonas allosaccharophila TaxID=656 RepID=UPI003D230B13
MKINIDVKTLKMICVVSFFLFSSKLAGLLKELVVASQFGVGYEVDSYSFVFELYTWPIGLFMSVLTVVLVPLISRAKRDNVYCLTYFSREIFGGVILLSLILSILFYVYFSMYGEEINSYRKTTDAILNIYPYFTVYLIAGFLSTFISVLMIANSNHTNSLCEGIIPIFIMFFVMIFSGYLPLTLGLISGAFFQFLLLYGLYTKRYGLIIPKFSFLSIGWREFKNGFSIVLFGQILISSTTLIDQVIASKFSEGTLSTISYSTKISSIFMVVVSLSITRAMLPIFSQRGVVSGINVLRDNVIKWGGVFLFLGFLVSVLCSIYSERIISLVYERGAFLREDVVSVSRFFSISSYQFPFYFSAMVFITFFNAQRRYLFIMLSGLVGFLIKVAFYFIFIDILGDEVIIYSTVCMYAATFLFFFVSILMLKVK